MKTWSHQRLYQQDGQRGQETKLFLENIIVFSARLLHCRRWESTARLSGDGFERRGRTWHFARGDLHGMWFQAEHSQEVADGVNTL